MSEITEDQKTLIYQALIETLIKSGADNHLSLIFSYDDKDEYEILIQKSSGKTTAQVNSELNGELDTLRKANAELEKELESFNAEHSLHCKIIPSLEAHSLETMAMGLKASIDFWHKNTSNKMQGHIEHGILGKRSIDNPDSIPVEVLVRDMDSLQNQAKALKESK
jgi:hypothetical protein